MKRRWAATLWFTWAIVWIPAISSGQTAAFEYILDANCIQCHSSPPPKTLKLPLGLCLFNEGATWHHDKHRVAFEALTGPLAEHMQKQLRWEQKVSEDVRCLSCHAGRRADQPELPGFQDNLANGVGCQVCHGPGSDYDSRHQRREWRALAATEKETRHGMIDVRNPLTRARLCASCHVGNAAQGKVVTHEMYAAGHPPLPSFELATFSHAMPRHWRPLPEKGQLVDESAYVAANPTMTKRGELPVLRDVVWGNVVVAIESLRLQAALAGVEGGRQWPELAALDCQACHHDLTRPSWRQTRASRPRVPGRPMTPAWTLAGIPIVLQVATHGDDDRRKELEEQFESARSAYVAAFVERPFGTADKVGGTAQALADWLEETVVPLLDSASWDTTTSQAALASLWDAFELNEDFHAARQLAWSAERLLVELRSGYPMEFRSPAPLPDDPELLEKRIEEDIAQWREWRGGTWEANASKIEGAFRDAGLWDSLKLALPAGADTSLAEYLGSWLASMAAYQPARILDESRAMRAGLSP